MIVKAMTGEYDDAKEYTAWELAADWWWIELGYFAVVVGGRQSYDEVTATRNDAVRLSRLYATTTAIRQINRYVNPELSMRLVKPTA
jgi:hypothetical protein